MFTNLKRAFQFASADFYRNRGMSVAAIFILLMTTLLVTSLFFMRGISSFLIGEIENKIDITAYFKEDANEQQIIQLGEEIKSQFSGVTNVVYISQQQALDNFLAKHQDDPVLARALTEVGGNPFLPSLNITTNGDAAQYGQVAEYLQQDIFANSIEKVDFSQKRDTIEKVLSITDYINKFGIGLTMLLMLVAMLVVFNTVKLVIDFSRDEITTMRIVGASNWFINAPFIIEGGLFGAISFAASLVITALFSYVLSRAVGVIVPGFSLFGFFLSHILWIVLIQWVFAVGLGVVSSFLATRKYLKI